MRFEFEGLDKLITRLEQVGKNVEEAKKEALDAGATLLQKEVKKRAPKRTYNLERHIEKSEIKNDEVEVYVDQQGKAYYGYFHEFGTSKMRARPFMGPAFNASRYRIQREMVDKLRQRMLSP